jgi:hypothetical protein
MMKVSRTLKSGGTLYGHLTVTVYEVKNGRKVRKLRMAKKNQITNAGREVVLALLAQDPAGTDVQANPDHGQIWSLAVGDDGTPVSVLDTSLYGELGRYDLTIPLEREYIIVPPNIFEIHVHKEIPAGTLTGSVFAEAGLLTMGDGVVPATQILYARQTHPDVTKGAAMAIEYDWRLGMLVQ